MANVFEEGKYWSIETVEYEVIQLSIKDRETINKLLKNAHYTKPTEFNLTIFHKPNSLNLGITGYSNNVMQNKDHKDKY